MKNGWTGGQYSLFRAIFGAYLLVHLATLIPWGAELFSSEGVLPRAETSPLAFLFPNVLSLYSRPWFVIVILTVGTGLSLLLSIGAFDRVAAVGLWYVWACLLGRNPLIANPGLPYVGWMLLAHACLPAAPPYGSWAARGRSDPAGSWRMPEGLFAAAWILMAVGYSYSGAMKLGSPSWLDGSALARVLENPLARPGPARDALLSLPDGLLRAATWGVLGLEIAFGPLALVRRLRPWLWTTMLVLHLSLIMLIDFADLSLGMVMLHLLTFDPAWVPGLRAPSADQLFYDGCCGLCHGAVRFVLAEDNGEGFRFAPLQGRTLSELVSLTERTSLPDSLVMRTTRGALLTKSSGVIHVLKRLGGVWRVLGEVGSVIPRRVLDAVYDAVARVRLRLVARPADMCPVIPQALRMRFDP